MRQISKDLMQSKVALVLCALALAFVCFVAQPAVAGDVKDIGKPGDKIALDADHYFVFSFDKQPKLGTAIMRVEVFTRDGARDTSFTVAGDADMPAMRGAHSSGSKQFALSNKQVYLLPVSLVMPGEWELKFSFEKNGKKVLVGAYRFKV